MRTRPGPAVVLALAALPFLAKAAAVAVGLPGYALQSLYKPLQLLVPLAWRRRIDGAAGWRALWPTDEPLPDRRTVAWAVGIALALAGSSVGVGALVLPLLGVEAGEVRASLDARFSLTPALAAALVLFLSTLNAGLEELHFRAWLDRELSARWGDAAGIALSALAFGGMHVLIFLGAPGLPALAVALVPIPLAIAGAAWSLLARRRGGMHAAWLSHGLTDALLLAAGLHWLGYF